MKKLSIIIPYYNMEDYIGDLLKCLRPQVTDEVQVLIVDDGSVVPLEPLESWYKVVRQDNRGLAGARNTGLRHTDGEYISFIDADDIVADNFVDYVVRKIDTEHFDYMDLSWKSLPGEIGGKHFDYKLNSDADSLDNPSVCTRIFKRTFIGDHRFNEKKRAAEDEDFTRRLDFTGAKKAVATEYMYFYRTTTPGSLSKQYMSGKLGMKRIVYFFRHVTADMTYLIEDFRQTYEESEIFLMTYQNDIPELERYCSIWEPQPMRGMELRGEPWEQFTLIQTPIQCDIVLYISRVYEIGGIETFLYNFAKAMDQKDKKVTVLYEAMDEKQKERIGQFAKCVPLTKETDIRCGTLIMNRVFDTVPACVKYDQIVQMIHACADCCDFDLSRMNEERDKVIIVSEAAAKSWEYQIKDSEVIHNLCLPEKGIKKPLIFMSFSRFGTPEKGQRRMIKLAELMEKKGMSYLWLYFSDTVLQNVPKGLVHMDPRLDVRGWMQAADYVVQLSDSESFCYTVVEALGQGVPVIVTPLPVYREIGVKNTNAHFVPLDIPDDFDPAVFVTDKKTAKGYVYDNLKIMKQWEKVLKDVKPKKYIPVRIIADYHDSVLNREMKKGEVVQMEERRAMRILNAGYLEKVEDRKDGQ